MDAPAHDHGYRLQVGSFWIWSLGSARLLDEEDRFEVLMCQLVVEDGRRNGGSVVRVGDGSLVDHRPTLAEIVNTYHCLISMRFVLKLQHHLHRRSPEPQHRQ